MKYIYFDTETTKLIKKENNELISFPYMVGFTTGNGNFKIAWHDKINDVFLKTITDELKSSEDRCIKLCGFNVYYDVNVMLPFFNEYWKGSLHVQLNGNRKFMYGHYKLKIDGQEYKIIFEDYWIFNKDMSLNDWAELLKMPTKISFDYDKWGFVEIEGDKLIYKDHKSDIKTSDFNSEMLYLKNDVLILPHIQEFINKFKKIVVDVTKTDESLAPKLKIRHGFSSASFSKYVASLKIRKNFDDVFRPYISEKMYLFFRRSFMGGYTAGNKNLLVVDCLGFPLIYNYDVNSQYPYIMSNGLPEGRITKKKMANDDIEWVIISTKGTKLKEKYDYLTDLPIKKDLNDGKPWLCSKRLFEVLCLMLEGPIIVHEKYYSRRNNLLSVMIKDLYKTRKSETTDKLTNFSIKLLLNSLYGKTCEKTHTKMYICTNSKIRKFNRKNTGYKSILCGIYAANESRAILLETILNNIEKPENFLYCDTDSITFNKKIPEKITIGNKLGQWKLEGKFYYFSRPMVLKKYMLENDKGMKVAVSGFNRYSVMNIMTKEQRRLLFSPNVNILWARAKPVSFFNSDNQISILNLDVQTNEAIPITHKLIFKDNQFYLLEL